MKLVVPFFLGKSDSSNTKSKNKNKKTKKSTHTKSNSNPPRRPLLHTHSNTSTSSNDSISLSQDCKLGISDLEIVLQRLGSGGYEEVAAVLAEADRDSDGRINLNEFLQPEISSEEDELREVFRVYDVNCDGKISAEELRDVFLTIGDMSCSIDDCRRMIGVVDSDGDGFVCFRDFAKMMFTAKAVR